MRLSLSKTVTSCRSANIQAHDKPATPLPTTAMRSRGMDAPGRDGLVFSGLVLCIEVSGGVGDFYAVGRHSDCCPGAAMIRSGAGCVEAKWQLTVLNPLILRGLPRS